MSIIKQSAGDMKLTVYTDGWPLQFYLEDAQGQQMRLSLSDIHDVRYAIDRVLDQLPKT